MDKFIHRKGQFRNHKRKLLPIRLILDKLCSAAYSGQVMVLKTMSGVRGSKLSTVGRETVQTPRFSRPEDELEQGSSV